MNNDKNKYEDFFFFILKLVCTCLAIVAMYLAYDMYTDKKLDEAIEDASQKSLVLFEDILRQLFDSSLTSGR